MGSRGRSPLVSAIGGHGEQRPQERAEGRNHLEKSERICYKLFAQAKLIVRTSEYICCYKETIVSDFIDKGVHYGNQNSAF